VALAEWEAGEDGEMGREAEEATDPGISRERDEAPAAGVAAPAADPFARLAEALPGLPPPASHRRLPSSRSARKAPGGRRSQPSFSDLAPVLPPPKPSSHPASLGRATRSAPPARHVEGPALPSVIIADEVAASDGTLPAAPHRLSDEPTLRGRDASLRARRGPSTAVVVALLVVSLLVFGAGVVVLVLRS
jgi:hypothetical protein